MNADLIGAAEDALRRAGIDLVRLYTDAALELNALDVTARSYAVRTDDFLLQTTRNIPDGLRLPLELDLARTKGELIEYYRNSGVQRACENFILRIVAVIDECFEDIFDLAMQTCSPELDERGRQRKIKSQWATDGDGRTEVAKYLVDTAGLRAPANTMSTVDMVFDRYCELREVRHSLAHGLGRLSPKNLARLNQLQDRLPAPIRHGSLAAADFLVDGRVKLELADLLAIRRWCYETVLGFLITSFAASA